MLKQTLIAGLLFSAACVPNKLPAPQVASHPPATDLTCPREPSALTDAEVMEDDAIYRANPASGHPHEDAFDATNIIAGRSCRDALHRVCQWHKDRGDQIDCDKPPMVMP